MSIEKLIRKVCKEFHKKFPDYSIVAYREETYYEGYESTIYFVTDAFIKGKNMDLPENKELNEILHWQVDKIKEIYKEYGEMCCFFEEDPDIILSDLTYIYKKYE